MTNSKLEKLRALDRYNGIEKDAEGVYIMRDEAEAILALPEPAAPDALRDAETLLRAFLDYWNERGFSLQPVSDHVTTVTAGGAVGCILGLIRGAKGAGLRESVARWFARERFKDWTDKEFDGWWAEGQGNVRTESFEKADRILALVGGGGLDAILKQLSDIIHQVHDFDQCGPCDDHRFEQVGDDLGELWRSINALDRTPPQTERSNEMSDESGWLIELPMTKGVICWWAGNGGGDYPYGIVWTEDSMKAVRFSRREDAEKVIVGLGQWHLDQEPIATSHEWVGSTPPQKPDAAIASAPSQGVNERDWSKIRDYMDCLGDTEEEKKLRIRWVREMKAENKELRARLAALHSPEPPKAGKP